jgi:hypothetical protein
MVFVCLVGILKISGIELTTMEKVFEQMVDFVNSDGEPLLIISQDDFDLWQQDYIWEALHGQRYGQSFCNRFGITDNHLYYNNSGIAWANDYIKNTYLARP